MQRLTHERANGIKSGYWSAAKKEELVQRLAAYEDTGLEPEEVIELKKLVVESGLNELHKQVEKDDKAPDRVYEREAFFKGWEVDYD